MKISVIIPVYNAETTIERCLGHMFSQERPPEETILIDNNSSDRSVELIKEFIHSHSNCNIILEHESKKGPGAARNKGLLKATGDIIAFTDADCFVHKDWLKNLLKVYGETGADGVGGVAEIFCPVTASEKLQAIDHIMPGELLGASMEEKYSALFNGLAVITFNGSYKKEALDKAGGFDEDLSVTGEDVDLCMRIFQQGGKLIVWHPEVQVWHMPRKKFMLYAKRIFQYREILARLLKKHFNKELFIQFKRLKVIRFNFFFNVAITLEAQMIFACILLAVIFKGLFLVVLFFSAVIFYVRFMKRVLVRSRHLGLSIGLRGALAIAGLDIVKKLSSEAGRIYGAVKNRSIFI